MARWIFSTPRSKSYVFPFQAQQLPAAQTGGEVEVVELVHSGLLGFAEECTQLVGSQRFHLFVLHLWKCTALRGILIHQPLLHGEVVG